MRCLVNGDVSTDKINTALITLYKEVEKIEDSISTIEDSINELSERIDNIVSENGLTE